jgi:hypothetical protein
MPFITDAGWYYIDRVMKDWLQVIKQNIVAKDSTLNTVLFPDDQMIVGSAENELQRAAYILNSIADKCNFKISVNKTKAIAMRRKINVRIN